MYPPTVTVTVCLGRLRDDTYTKAFSMEESKMNVITNNQTLSVSSSEIAEMVEKRHDNEKRTIETHVSRNIIASPQFEEKPTTGRTSTDYIFEGEKGKRDSTVVVALF